ncbi:MAG: ATP-binding cassette domain-containing protein, partial [Candidatus Altiarchaeales archaeon]|nr:ATP-binding cassette domain-containing protein [Candidatus Altiarchaeales archaeon]
MCFFFCYRALDGINLVIGVNRPNQLSGGQQQRVAVAGSLANDPKIAVNAPKKKKKKKKK